MVKFQINYAERKKQEYIKYNSIYIKTLENANYTDKKQAGACLGEGG